MKLLSTLLLSSTLLFSNSIVGAWTIDKEKAEKNIKANAKNEMEQFVLGMMATAMIDMQFKDDGSCTLAGKNRVKCWVNSGENFSLYGDKDGISGTVTLSDNNHFKLVFSEIPLSFEFIRVNSSSMETPDVVMVKDRVYHAKNVKDEMFSTTGDAFLMFTGENEYFNLLSDGFSSFSVSEFKAVIEKNKSKEGGFLLEKGAYSLDRGGYKVKNHSFYTIFNEKKIEVITPKHIKYNGYDYYLE